MMWLWAVVAGGASMMIAWRLHKNRRPTFRHAINPDRCTGCDACVAVCPEHVLDLRDNKCWIARPHGCTGCEACALACPTMALAVHRRGQPPSSIQVPDLDQNYQTRVAGQYLIGELAGKPLIKNAANLGRGVIEHMREHGLRAGAHSGFAEGSDARHVKCVDVVIVGAGPGGLSAALSCVQRGLSYALIEKGHTLAPTLAAYPRGKWVMAEPYEVPNLSLLPVFDAPATELLEAWYELCERVGIQASFGETVESIKSWGDATFDVATTLSRYRCQRVVVASGGRGQPRRLGVPGEHLPKVRSALENPVAHRGHPVLVVGGGDSALEAALELADAGARVVLAFRGRSFDHALRRNCDEIAAYVATRRIRLALGATIDEIDADSVTLSTPEGRKRYRNSATFVLLGTDPVDGWLRALGVEYRDRPHHHRQPDSDELVDDLLGDAAIECPDDPAVAAALVFGVSVAPRRVGLTPASGRPADPVARRDRPRRRAGSNRLARPIPLSEFVRRRGRDGRRDDLSPSERTRVLRMLHDEGGRRADQDAQPPALHSAVAPPPAPAGPPLFLAPGRSGPTQIADDAPTQALIVGLARARSAPPPRRIPQPLLASRPPQPPGSPQPPRSPQPPPPSRSSLPRTRATLPPPFRSPQVVVTGRIPLPPIRPVVEDSPNPIEALVAIETNPQRVQANLTARPQRSPKRRNPQMIRGVSAGSRVRSLSDVDWDLD